MDDPISYDIYIYIVYNLGECGILHMTSLDDEILYAYELSHDLRIISGYRIESWMKTHEDICVLLGISIHEDLNWDKY